MILATILDDETILLKQISTHTGELNGMLFAIAILLLIIIILLVVVISQIK